MKPRYNRYTISQATTETAARLFGSDDHSQTTIRCTLNDVLDLAQSNGYRVHFGYNQERAVATVKRLLATARDVAH